MERVMVIGCSGAGKSTFSKALQEITHLPLIHLDREYWKSNWVETPNDEWEIIVKDLSSKTRWIIDGNYGRTMQYRLEHADTVVFLNRSTWLCVYRIIKRTIKYYGQSRPDMATGCHERFDLKFLMYVLRYNHARRPGILKKLQALKGEKKIIVLHSEREVNTFLLSAN